MCFRPVEIPEEEEEDDPSAMPTPQVKVGPDGQLIIDEQSLVIEQTDARRDGEILASEATIEDDNSHSGGFYKKHKRSKEWPKWETFKFYRVLNVVGTDFLLMQTLFPNRSRQEIKQKYKKEERVNRQLVEKALKFHQEFDTDMLEKQLGKSFYSFFLLNSTFTYRSCTIYKTMFYEFKKTLTN